MRMTSPTPAAPSRLRSIVVGLVTAAVCAAVLCPLPASAGGYLYAGKRKTINCGILVLPSSSNYKQPLNASYATTSAGVGDLFNLLDARTDLKPAGWSFDNPYASVDSSGRKYTKDDPRFWLVPLDTARNLSRMQVLYLPVEGNVELRDEDREQLRRFVDSGGVLWIDNVNRSNALTFKAPTAPSSDPGTFFMPYIYFYSAGGGYDIPWSRHHPLLTMPYWLDDQEVTMLGSDWGGSGCSTGYNMNPSPLDPPIISDVLFPIVAKSNGSSPSVTANAYGSGRVVATANFVGKGCFLPYPYSQASLKLAYNIVAWSSSWTDLRKDPRRSGKSIDTVGGSSLVKVWSAPVGAPSGESGAVIYKNIVFYTCDSTLYAMDAVPSEDQDHNGNIDDGIQDMSAVTKGQDLIWMAPCDGKLSSPSVVTCLSPDDPSKTLEAVLVQSSQGTVYMFDAFPNQGGVLKPVNDGSNCIISWSTDVTAKPSPPIYSGGWVFAAAGDGAQSPANGGRLYAFNPALAAWKVRNGRDRLSPTDPDYVASEWTVPDRTLTSNTRYKAGPTFGYVTASNSGAVVGMVYWCVSAQDTGSTGMQQEMNDYVYGVPVSVKNDRLKLRTASSDRKTTEFMTSFPDLRISSHYPDPVIRVQSSASGLTWTVHPNSAYVNNQIVERMGYFVLETSDALPPDAVVYADYAIDYSNTGGIITQPLPKVRAPLLPSSIGGDAGIGNGVPKTEVSSMPAMGVDNILYLNGQRKDVNTQWGAGGSTYAIKNDGNSAQSFKWSYMFHGGVKPDCLQGITTNASYPIPGLLAKKPGAAGDIYSCAIQSPQPTSSPVVWGDKVFVTVSGQNGGGALVCLKANSNFTIQIVENAGVDASGKPIRRAKRLYDSATGRALQVKLWQPNLLTGPSGLGPSMEAVTVPSNMIDREKGTITFTGFEKLKLVGGVGVRQETNIFSSSLPVWVLVDEVEIPIDWSTWGPTASLASLLGGKIAPTTTDCVDLSSWNNLLWYYAPPNCGGIHSSPVLIGDTVYFVTDDGVLYAVDAETGETTGAPMNSWDPADPDWKVDPKFVTWREEVEPGPVAMPTDANVSPSGSNGVLLVPGPSGLNAYSNPTTLVADSNRLVEVDSSGDVTWSLDSIMVPVNTPASGKLSPNEPALPRRKVPINKPSRARYMETGEILLVNTGSSQVAKVDRAGNVSVQQIQTASSSDGWIRMAYDKFADPKELLRPGQPRQLTSPTDALMWQEYEPGPNNQTATMHCLVADSGNGRVLDLVYRFNSSGKLMNNARDEETGYILPELNWVSNTEYKGEKYIFECLQVVPNNPTEQMIWAAISNYRTDAATPNPQGLGGAIVSLKYRVRSSPTDAWNYNANGSGNITNGLATAKLGVEQPLACPKYFQVIDKWSSGPGNTANMQRSLLICDNRGVYEVDLATGNVGDKLFDKQYREQIDRDNIHSGVQPTLVPLLASSAQELPNGKWLIANSYSGTNKSGTKAFNGEVFEFDPSDGRISWSSPKLNIIYDPNTGEQVDFEQVMGGSYRLQQPRSAFRQF